MLTHPLDDQTELRLLEPRHAPAYYAMIEAHRAHIGTFVRTAARLQSVEEARDALQKNLESFAAGQAINYGIWHREALVGEILLFRIDMRDRAAELGYFLAEDVQGRGLVTRACEALLDHAFEGLALHRVEIRCATENQRSLRIPERLGFVREGRARECQWLNERWVDHAIFSMLDHEWRARNR